MAYEVPGLMLGTLAAPSTAFSTKQYRAVTQATSTEGFIVTPSDSGSMIGIMQNAPTVTGESVQIMLNGVSKAVFNDALAVSVNFIVGSGGKLHSTGGAAAGARIYGPVLVAAASSGIGSVLLDSQGIST